MVEAKISKTLENLYYNPENPVSFSGARQIINSVKNKIPKSKIIEWLDGQEVYNRHKSTRRRFKRRIYNVCEVDGVWEADLIDVRAISSYNDGYNYLLVVIDVLSKFAWVEPLKNKSSDSVRVAFTKILSKTGGRTPHTLQTDRGKEFIGSPFQHMLEKKHIVFRIARNPDVKAAVVERFNRTLKERIWRYFTHSRSKRYVDVLSMIVHAYNHTKHSGTKFEPCNISNKNAHLAFANLERRYGNKNLRQPKYQCGDLVRISSNKAVFVKGYEGGWSKEVFKIDYVSTYRQPPTYVLSDLSGEKIDGVFYEEELARVTIPLKNKT